MVAEKCPENFKIPAPSYDAPMDDAAVVGPVPIPWWRFLLLSGMGVALYVVVRAVATDPQTHPVLLAPAALLGGAVGLLVGRWDVAVLNRPSAPGRGVGRRGSRRRTAMSKSAARSYLVGLTGLGLLLARALSPDVMEWMMLGLVALMVGGAAHAWVMARHYEHADAAEPG